MGEVVNLRRVRKGKARAERESEAAANRAKFGRAKDERELDEARRKQAEKRLDGHKTED